MVRHRCRLGEETRDQSIDERIELALRDPLEIEPSLEPSLIRAEKALERLLIALLRLEVVR